MDGFTSAIPELIELLNAPDRATAEAICRSLVISDDDLVQFLLAARVGLLEPYRYATHFTDYIASDASIESIELTPIASSEVGPMSRPAVKAFRRIEHAFNVRRLFAAHLLYTPGHTRWHLFYFDQRDSQVDSNHWKAGGAHIHYSRESYSRSSLREVWGKVCAPSPEVPGHTYIRYVESRSAG
jgi:hypothetical protein